MRQLSLVERQNDMLLRHHGYGQQASQLLLGMNPTVPVKKEKKEEEKMGDP